MHACLHFFVLVYISFWRMEYGHHQAGFRDYYLIKFVIYAVMYVHFYAMDFVIKVRFGHHHRVHRVHFHLLDTPPSPPFPLPVGHTDTLLLHHQLWILQHPQYPRGGTICTLHLDPASPMPQKEIALHLLHPSGCHFRGDTSHARMDVILYPFSIRKILLFHVGLDTNVVRLSRSMDPGIVC
ncbi:hypothetical protein BC832DRAFT_67671 [Gaertneriomyces semiglobifer]|nr:hypothetical protein BC832DRAFT_67671 [Gaertneriomyces semiglobifer]